MQALGKIIVELKDLNAELHADNYLAEQRERMRDKYHDEQRDTRPWWEIAADDAGVSNKDFA